MSGALSGVRIIDLSRVLAGPWATQTLADLGADVIKVERPNTGDDTRAWGPPFLKDAEGAETPESAYFLSANRGKRSITLDIASPAGQEIVRNLIKQSDIVVENFKVDGLVQYGLDYASLRAVKPDLIYCSITGFGQTGPRSSQPGYDAMIQAMGGLMSVTGEPDSVGGGPQKTGVAVADLLTGLYAAIAILAALAHRHKSGEGQYIDLALFDVQAACLANQAMNYLTTGTAPERLGNAHPNIVPYQSFTTQDGHIMIAVGNDAQFARFAEIISQPELATDARFAKNADRVAHRGELIPLLATALARQTSADWLARFEAANIPCAPINTIDQVFNDPQAQSRGLVTKSIHPTAGEIDLVASPIRMSETPVSHERPPPPLGAHTDEVLRELLAMKEPEIAELRRKGVL